MKNIVEQQEFRNKMLQPIFFKLFLLFKLPMAFLSGMKLKEFSTTHTLVHMRYSFLNKNPFGSIYFACLSMAGELASGMLAAAVVYKSIPKVSMLVVGMEVEFMKKAIGLITFRCNQGEALADTIQKSIATGEGQTFEAITIATDEHDTQIAIFKINWSFKVKQV